ncbi:outer membrane lipoprotein carrier protein LolA [candidate division WOR-3 bacterium]|nr:outer membrane lipoprotein carrier protein LolA [candidate division WOR-3 bacterium]
MLPPLPAIVIPHSAFCRLTSAFARRCLRPSLCPLTIASCLLTSPLSHASPSDSAWQALRHRYLSLRTLSGSFEQTVCSEFEGTCQSFSGTFAFHLPGRFRLEVTDPVRQLIVGTDSCVWFHFPDEQRVVRQTGSGSVPLLAFLAPVLDSSTAAEVSTDSTGTPVVRVVSDSPEALAGLVLELNAARDRIVGFAFDDDFGNHYDFRLLEQRWNPRLPGRTFQFSPPAGTVVEQQ